MGACCSSTFDHVADRTSSKIDSKMSEEDNYDKSLHKLLVLGPGGSGKSTIFRQLQWLHCGGIKPEDRSEFKRYIDFQIIRQMQAAIRHYLCDSTAEPKLQNAINIVQSYDRNGTLTEKIANYIKYIWVNEPRLKDIFNISRSNSKKVLTESTEYFWNNIDRITTDDYTPTKTDIINVRNMTTGIIEKKFTIKNVNLHIFDVGGQKAERKKWFHCFDGVRALLFVVAISSYNEVMFEENKTNSMVDALHLFDDTIHHQMFCNTPIILFLNKKDLFENKIKDIAITECPAFSDFGSKNDEKYINNNANDYVQTSVYVQSKFEQMNKNESRKIFSHITCAIDERNIENVFYDVVKIVIKSVLARIDVCV